MCIQTSKEAGRAGESLLCNQLSSCNSLGPHVTLFFPDGTKLGSGVEKRGRREEQKNVMFRWFFNNKSIGFDNKKSISIRAGSNSDSAFLFSPKLVKCPPILCQYVFRAVSNIFPIVILTVSIQQNFFIFIRLFIPSIMSQNCYTSILFSLFFRLLRGRT